MSETSATGGAPTPAARLEKIHNELAAERRRAGLATTLTAIVGVLALVLLGVYFAYGYTQLEEVTRAEELVKLAESLVTTNMPDVREAIETEVRKSSPAWAATMSRQALDSLPDARDRLEGYILEQIDKQLEERDVLSNDQFRGFVRANQAQLQVKIQELSSSEDLAAASLNELELMLNAHLQEDMEARALDLLDALSSANEKLERLMAQKGLTERERLELQVVMIARRLQQTETTLGGPAQPSTPVAAKSATESGSPPAIVQQATPPPGTAAAPEKKDAPPEVPKAEEKKDAPPAETPKVEEKKDAPPAEAPKTEAPKDAPAAEAPKANPPSEAPKGGQP